MNEKGETLGTTPFFFKIRPASKRNFSYLLEDQKREVPYECQLDWGGSLVPNLIWSPLFPVGTILSTVMMSTAAVSNAMYECKRPIEFKVENISEKIKKKRIAVIPIAVGSHELSERIIGFWKKTFFDKNKKDETFLWNDEVIEEFLYRGIDLYVDTSPHKIKRRFLNQIGHKLNLTHFLYFKVVDKKDHFEIKPILYDAFKITEVEGKYLKTFSLKKNKKTLGSIWSKILRNIDFFPNSITLTYQGRAKEIREVPLDLRQSGEFRTNSHPDAIPKALTLFGVESVHHPQFYDPWDWGGFLSPNFGASSWRSSYLINGSPYNFDFESYLFGYNAYLAGFTPLGQLRVGLGLNLAYISMSDNRGFENSKIGLMTGSFVSYYKFFGDRFYITGGVKNYNVPGSFTNRSEYRLKSWTEVYGGIGYYFPEVKSFARKLFGL